MLTLGQLIVCTDHGAVLTCPRNKSHRFKTVIVIRGQDSMLTLGQLIVCTDHGAVLTCSRNKSHRFN